MRIVTAMMTMSLLAATALAQVMTPIPAPSEPLPKDWQPPAPPPPPPPPAPVKALPVPDVVQRDAAGRAVLPAMPIEVLVFEKLDELTPEQKKQFAEKWSARRVSQEAMLVKNASEALALRADIGALDKITDWSQLTPFAARLASVTINPSASDWVKNTGVLLPNQVTAFTEAMGKWRVARKEDMEKEAGGDLNKTITVQSRMSIRERFTEPKLALDRMLVALAGQWPQVKGTLGLTGDALAAKEQAVASASTDAAKADAVASLLGTLSAEQMSAALKAVALQAAAPAPGTETPTK